MVTPYQFVNIRSRLSGHCLDVAGQSTTPGSKVVTWERNGQKNQLWYFDSSNWTIKTALNEFCLDYNPEGNTNMGAQVGVSQYAGNSNQQWDFDVAGGAAAVGGVIGGCPTGGMVSQPQMVSMPQMQWTKKEFMIKSVMDAKVVDIKGNNPAPNTLICMYNINKQKNQLWYIDQSGFIRSSLNDFVFYHEDAGQSLKMVPYSNSPKHQWRIQGDKIMNGTGNCLDIRGGKCSNGSELCAYTFKNKDNQRWIVQYL